MIRLIIITIAALFWLWLDRPAPSRLVQTDYCLIDYKAAGKDLFGEWHSAWVKGYGLCSLQDKFFDI